MTEYKIEARFVDGSIEIYETISKMVARSVYDEYINDEDCREVSYRVERSPESES